jgi:hypothetical protein
MRRTLVATLLLLATAPAIALAQDAAPAPADVRADVLRAETQGAQLYRHDQAAWHASDAIQASGVQPPGDGRGWLTLARDGRIAVRFFAEVDWEPVAYAQAIFDPATGKVSDARALSPAQPATAEERVLLRARDAAMARARNGLRCSGAINTVVLPGQGTAGDEIDVYVMSAWEGGDFVFGGHQRVRVSGDGTQVRDVYEHTRGCIPIEPEGQAPEGFEPIPLVGVSHLTSPAPNEFHVFLGLQHDREIMVGTSGNGRLWSVEKGRIREVEAEEAGK